jgi:putative ABC transport system substrate-binding protein
VRKRLRLLLAVIVVLGLCEPAAAERIYRVGFLGVRFRSTPANPDIYYDEWLRAMHKLGYVEGKNLVVEWRFAENKLDRLPALAAELAAMRLDAIVTHAFLPTAALQKATTRTPIVFAAMPDPVGNRIVSNLAHPGGNTTGLSLMSTDLSAKRLELLKELAPSMSSVLVLTNRRNPANLTALKSTQDAAFALGISSSPLTAQTADEIESSSASLSREHGSGLMILDDASFNGYMGLIARLMISHQIPSMCANPDLVGSGVLAGYGASGLDLYRRAAVLVDKILKGAKPGDLPVEQPSKLELVINKKTAKALGLEIPAELLVQANRVVE